MAIRECHTPGGAAALLQGDEIDAVDAHGSEHHEHAGETAVPIVVLSDMRNLKQGWGMQIGTPLKQGEKLRTEHEQQGDGQCQTQCLVSIISTQGSN